MPLRRPLGAGSVEAWSRGARVTPSQCRRQRTQRPTAPLSTPVWRSPLEAERVPSTLGESDSAGRGATRGKFSIVDDTSMDLTTVEESECGSDIDAHMHDASRRLAWTVHGDAARHHHHIKHRMNRIPPQERGGVLLTPLDHDPGHSAPSDDRRISRRDHPQRDLTGRGPALEILRTAAAKTGALSALARIAREDHVQGQDQDQGPGLGVMDDGDTRDSSGNWSALHEIEWRPKGCPSHMYTHEERRRLLHTAMVRERDLFFQRLVAQRAQRAIAEHAAATRIQVLRHVAASPPDSTDS